jgi:hypothetical protein
MKNNLNEIKIGSVIFYNFLYSNEEEKVGIVINIKKDLNFSAMIYLLCENEIDVIPFSIMSFKVLK